MNPRPPDEQLQPPQTSYYQRSDNPHPPLVVCPVRIVYDTQVLIPPDSNMKPNQVIYCNATNTFVPNLGYFNNPLIYLNGSQDIPYHRERLTTPNVFPGIMPNHPNLTQNRMPFMGYDNSPNSRRNPTPVILKNTNPHNIATGASNMPRNSLPNYDQNASQQNRLLLNGQNVLPSLSSQDENEKSLILETALHERQSSANNVNATKTVQKNNGWKKKKQSQDIASCGTIMLPSMYPNTIQQNPVQHNMLHQKDQMLSQQRIPEQNYSPIMTIEAMQPTRMPNLSSTLPVVQPLSNSSDLNPNLSQKMLTLNKVPPWILNQKRNEMRSLGTQTLPSSIEKRLNVVDNNKFTEPVENNDKFNSQSSINDNSTIPDSKEDLKTKNKLESEFVINASAKPVAHEETPIFRDNKSIYPNKNEDVPCIILPERDSKTDFVVIECMSSSETEKKSRTVKVVGTDWLECNSEAKIKVIEKINKENDDAIKHPENSSHMETQNKPTNSKAIEKSNLKTVPENSEVSTTTTTIECKTSETVSKSSQYEANSAENINEKTKTDADITFKETKMKKYLKKNEVDQKKEQIEERIRIIKNELKKNKYTKKIKTKSFQPKEQTEEGIRIIKNELKKDKRTKKIKSKNFQLNAISAGEKSDKTIKVIRNSHTIDVTINNVGSNEPYYLTHVIDGYIIQESNYPFPVQKPKSEFETMKEKSVSREESKMLLDEPKVLFVGYTPEIIKTWQTKQFVAHFRALGENSIADIFEDQELDGEALALVNFHELRTVGFEDDSANALIDFMKTVKQKPLDMPLLTGC